MPEAKENVGMAEAKENVDMPEAKEDVGIAEAKAGSEPPSTAVENASTISRYGLQRLGVAYRGHAARHTRGAAGGPRRDRLGCQHGGGRRARRAQKRIAEAAERAQEAALEAFEASVRAVDDMSEGKAPARPGR